MPANHLRAVEQSIIATEGSRKTSLFHALADRLENWENNCETWEELTNLLEMIQRSRIPKRYRTMVLRGIIEAYINQDSTSSDLKDTVAQVISSLDGKSYVEEWENRSLWNSRYKVLLHQLGHHF